MIDDGAEDHGDVDDDDADDDRSDGGDDGDGVDDDDCTFQLLIHIINYLSLIEYY